MTQDQVQEREQRDCEELADKLQAMLPQYSAQVCMTVLTDCLSAVLTLLPLDGPKGIEEFIDDAIAPTLKEHVRMKLPIVQAAREGSLHDGQSSLFN